MKGKSLLLTLWLTAVVLGAGMDYWHERQFLPAASDRTKDDVLIDVIGEFKMVVARYLWFRMDIFHEVLDSQGVAPEKQTEVLPLLRMVTLLDPSMTESYDQIVWDLYKGHGKAEKALEILEEGIKRNPNDYQLVFRRGLIAHLEKDHLAAHEYAIRALALTDQEFPQMDCLRLIYWSAKARDDRENMRRALSDLRRMRPNSPLWKREYAEFLESQPKAEPK